MTLEQVLERARTSMHSSAWGDVAKALIDMFPELPCGMADAELVSSSKEDPPYVRISEEAVGSYEPDDARAYAASIIRRADEADSIRKLMPNI